MKKLIIKKSLLLICTAIALCSCSSWEYEPKTYRITTTTMTCPVNYMYNSYDGMCYYTKPLFDRKPEIKPVDTKTKAGAVKRPKRAKKNAEVINCVKALNYCGVAQ